MLTKCEFARYLQRTQNPKIPASWAETKVPNAHLNGHTKEYSNGYSSDSSYLTDGYLDDKSIRTVYGLVPLKFALDWPVFASYDELAGCAEWMGGRIPTAEEARNIYSHVDGLKVKEAEQHLGKMVPAVNGYVHHILCAQEKSANTVDTYSMMEWKKAHHHPLRAEARAPKSSSLTLRVPMWVSPIGILLP